MKYYLKYELPSHACYAFKNLSHDSSSSMHSKANTFLHFASFPHFTTFFSNTFFFSPLPIHFFSVPFVRTNWNFFILLTRPHASLFLIWKKPKVWEEEQKRKKKLHNIKVGVKFGLLLLGKRWNQPSHAPFFYVKHFFFFAFYWNIYNVNAISLSVQPKFNIWKKPFILTSIHISVEMFQLKWNKSRCWIVLLGIRLIKEGTISFVCGFIFLLSPL